jgi:hypothetical protein
VNRPLPPRDRGDRNSAAKRASRSARVVPGVGGLVCRVAAVASRPRFGHCCATGGPRSFVWRRLSLTANGAASWASQVGLEARSRKARRGRSRAGQEGEGRCYLLIR